MVGILLSYWGGLFSGATVVSGRVNTSEVMKMSPPRAINLPSILALPIEVWILGRLRKIPSEERIGFCFGGPIPGFLGFLLVLTSPNWLHRPTKSSYQVHFSQWFGVIGGLGPKTYLFIMNWFGGGPNP